MYEAKSIFNNIDAIILAATSFLHDLEAMFASGRASETVGDVCLRHVSKPMICESAGMLMEGAVEGLENFRAVQVVPEQAR